MRQLWLFVVLGLHLAMGQLKNKPCDKAPLGSPAVLKLICQQLHQMDEENRQESLDSNLAPPEFPALHDCMNITCVCSELNSESIKGSECLYKGKRMEKLIRKEYRMMSDEERERFHSALNTMKKNGKFDEIAAIHAGFGNMGGAHSGPAFLPWHREYLKRLEFELRRVHPEVYLPYWDSTLDGHLPRPEDSAIFTTELFGTSIGPVLDGPFANWKTMRGKPLLRQVGKRQDAQPFMEDMVTFFLQQPANRFLAFSASRQECPEATEFNSFEFLHALVHKWIGGDMFDPMTSGNDPVFFMHHSFVDLIWENWRTWRQDRTLREIEYPLDDGRCMSAKHFLKAPMIPFSSESGRATTNADGLSNLYTDELYEYAPQPTCRSVKEGCGSRFLFCDTSVGKPRCVAKIRLGGSCGRLAPGQDVCYNGRCVDGFCEWDEDLQTSTDDIEVSESEETSSKELEDKITKEPMIESTTVEGLEATNQTHSDNSENETSTELFTTELTEVNVTETAEKLKLKVKTNEGSEELNENLAEDQDSFDEEELADDGNGEMDDENDDQNGIEDDGRDGNENRTEIGDEDEEIKQQKNGEKEEENDDDIGDNDEDTKMNATTMTTTTKTSTTATTTTSSTTRRASTTTATLTTTTTTTLPISTTRSSTVTTASSTTTTTTASTTTTSQTSTARSSTVTTASSTTATPTTTTTTTSPTSTATTASSTTTTSTTTTTTTTSTASTTTTPASTRWNLNWEPVATTDVTTTTTSTTEKKLEDFVWTTRAPMVTFTHMVATDTAPCFNFNECCQEWALQGQCSSNRNYMDEQCGASCNACIPSTPIVDDCSDRHEKCGFWARARECYSNPYWMAENCRQSCGHCEKTRAQVCSRKSQQIASSSSDWVTSTQKPRDHECYNADCSDKYSCCSHWVKKGECQTNFKFMMCNCRSACGMCGSMTDWKDSPKTSVDSDRFNTVTTEAPSWNAISWSSQKQQKSWGWLFEAKPISTRVSNRWSTPVNRPATTTTSPTSTTRRSSTAAWISLTNRPAIIEPISSRVVNQWIALRPTSTASPRRRRPTASWVSTSTRRTPTTTHFRRVLSNRYTTRQSHPRPRARVSSTQPYRHRQSKPRPSVRRNHPRQRNPARRTTRRPRIFRYYVKATPNKVTHNRSRQRSRSRARKPSRSGTRSRQRSRSNPRRTRHRRAACMDQHKECPRWAERGDCRQNPWMEKNCPTSCQSCFGESDDVCGSSFDIQG